MEQDTIEKFISNVGRSRFERELGLKTQLVTRAISDGLMPSPWARDVRIWCEARGVKFPEHLFKWRDLLNDADKSGDARNISVK